MMGRRVIETVTGAIVLLIAGYFLVFAYNSADLQPVTGYQLSARFASVGGLSVGADVRIGGVKVGTVTGQDIDPESYRAVVTFDLREGIRLPSDTVASVASDGILGGKYLRLQIGNAETYIEPGGRIAETRDALSLEELLGRAIFLLTEDEN